MDSPPREREYRHRSRSPAARAPSPRPGGEDERGKNPGNNLFVSGVSNRVRDEDLETLFQRYGRLEKCTIVLDPHTKESRGFAFITFERPEDADSAIAGLNGTVLENRTLVVEKAKRGRARTPTPGRYFGPPKTGPSRDDRDRRRYDDRGPRDYRDDRDRRYDDRRDRYDRRDSRDRSRDYDRDRRDDRRDRDRYDDRSSRRYDDRR
ncbi:hypothetical protein DFJ74DRAFT_712013 [Hyaloraphidium curvatum]|nr:hypothetical protein DFJ74DRAFT_712013 [Hyaloraphidium curvatum]